MQFLDKELILFDFDGTLIDSVPDLAPAVNHMLSSLDYPAYSEDTIRMWVGNGAQMLVKRALSGDVNVNENLDMELFSKALDIFLQFYKDHICIDTLVYPGVPETLKALKNEGYLMAIITNKPYAFIGPILNALELDGLFDLNIGGDSLSVKKPDPMPLLHACEKLNVSVEKALMVGDSKNDILAAKAADMQSIGVTYGYNYGESIDMYEPDAVVDHFSDLTALIKQSNIN